MRRNPKPSWRCECFAPNTQSHFDKQRIYYSDISIQIRADPGHSVSVNTITPFIFMSAIRAIRRLKPILIPINRSRSRNRHHCFWSISLLRTFDITSKIPWSVTAIVSSRAFHHLPVTNVSLDGANGSKNKHVSMRSSTVSDQVTISNSYSGRRKARSSANLPEQQHGHGANGSKNKHVCDQVQSGIKSPFRTATLGEMQGT